MSALLPNIPKPPCNKHNTNLKTLNPELSKSLQDMQQGDQTLLKVSQLFRDDDMISNLDSCSESELKELKEKLILEAECIKKFIEQIDAHDVELRKVEKSMITGRKRAMPINPERETKRNRLETRKVEAVMMKKCGGILEKLMAHRHGWVFNTPVDVVALRLSDYYQVVKRPMDLGTVKMKLSKGVYRSPLDFAKDVRLTFDNALLYNRKGEEAHTMATVLLDMFEKLFGPAYKKFEVEHKSVVVENQKSSKPSQRDREKPLQMHPQAALPMKISKEADKKPVPKQKNLVPEAKENPQMKREMSIAERNQLGLVLQDLDGEYLDEILQIVAKRNSNMTTPDGDGEIELDVETIDSETMWDLHKFLRLKLKAKQKNKAT